VITHVFPEFRSLSSLAYALRCGIKQNQISLETSKWITYCFRRGTAQHRFRVEGGWVDNEGIDSLVRCLIT